MLVYNCGKEEKSHYNKHYDFDIAVRLEEQLINYPCLITTQEFVDFFDMSNITALSIIKNIPHIFYANRGGYKVRKALLIEDIIENQTVKPNHLVSNEQNQINENLKE